MLHSDLKHLLSTNIRKPWRGVAMFAQHWMWLLASWNQPGTRTPCTLCDGYKAKVSWRFWCCCAHLCHCLSTGESSSSGPSKKCFWQITLFSTFFTITTTSAETPECHSLVCHWWVLTFRHPSGELALIKSTQIRRSAFFVFCFVLVYTVYVPAHGFVYTYTYIHIHMCIYTYIYMYIFSFWRVRAIGARCVFYRFLA